MASSKARSSDGCWTCRLRRKKCDEARPRCLGCSALEIDCLYSDVKPEWMDGGERQKDKAEQVKAEVKRKAGWRRERKYIQGLENSLHDLEMTDGPDGTHLSATPRRSGSSATVAAAAGAATSAMSSATPGLPFVLQDNRLLEAGTGDLLPHADGHSIVGSSRGSTALSSTSDLTPESPSSTPATAQGTSPTSVTSTGPNLEAFAQPTADTPFASDPSHAMPGRNSERELSFAMIYLDYVFPFLFPFYHPPMTSGGRAWLLVLLMNNKALYHAALSLASYFFSGWMHTLDGEMHAECHRRGWIELQRQQELSVRELMTDITDINERGVKGRLREGTRVLASIIQILCSEVAVGNAGSWSPHLGGAIVLLDQIMKDNAAMTPDSNPCWSSLMRQLSDGDPSNFSLVHPLNSHQAALSFFTAVLFHFDIVSSSALETAPRLQSYHISLLSRPSELMHMQKQAGRTDARLSHFVGIPDVPSISLSDVTGTDNWAIVAVGEVAALDAWKKEQKSQGKLSMTDLVLRASQIETGLRDHIAALCNEDGNGDSRGTAHNELRQPSPAEALLNASLRVPGTVSIMSNGGCRRYTHIWALSALLYLLVVVSGWQPASPNIRAAVAETLRLLLELPNPACLRTVGWPFAVAGCLASVEQEESFREIVRAIGGLHVFGNINEASRIMEAVWERRREIEQGESGEWDLARCFRLLGRPAFLV